MRNTRGLVARTAALAASALASQALAGPLFSFEDSETVTIGDTTYVGSINPVPQAPGTGEPNGYIWGSSFDTSQVEHSRSTIAATDGSYSMRVRDPNGGFSWGTQVLFNDPLNQARFGDLTSSTKLLMDVSTPGASPLPNGLPDYQVGFWAVNYAPGFLDSYNVSGAGNNYQFASSPASQEVLTTQTYVWDFGEQMRSAIGAVWGGLTDYVILHFNQNSGNGTPLSDYYWDNLRVINVDTAVRPTWNAPITGGGWTDGASWQNGVPNGVGAAAIFYGRNASNGTAALSSTVTLNSAVSVGSIVFDAQITANQNIGASAAITSPDLLPAVVNYTVSGTGSLALDVTSGSAEIYAVAGNHNIDVPVSVNDNLRIDTAAGFGPDANPNLPGGGRYSSVVRPSVTFGGPLTLAADVTLRTSGAGTVSLNGGVSGDGHLLFNGGRVNLGANVDVATLHVAPAARVAVAGAGTVVRTGALTIGDGALASTFDLNSAAAIIDYTGDSPIAAIGGYVASAYNGGAWDGAGLTSSAAAAAAAGTGLKTAVGYGEASDLGLGSFLGQPVDGTAVLVRYTIYGDANLDQTTDIGDFAILAANFNQPGRWTRGNFNFDANVDIGDFALLAANFNQTTPAARSSVPEPALAAMALPLLMLARRRR